MIFYYYSANAESFYGKTQDFTACLEASICFAKIKKVEAI